MKFSFILPHSMEILNVNEVKTKKNNKIIEGFFVMKICEKEGTNNMKMGKP